LAGSSPAERDCERREGLPTPDGYIAAIAASRGFVVASKDTAAFTAAGIVVIDPWKATA
jgi:toxin FitB